MVSGCGAAGSALPWGGRGRKFKSCHSDQKGDSKGSPFFFVFLRLSLVFSLFVFSFLFRETFKNRGFWADFSDCYLKLLPKFFAFPFRTPNCYPKSFTTFEWQKIFFTQISRKRYPEVFGLRFYIFGVCNSLDTLGSVGSLFNTKVFSMFFARDTFFMWLIWV